MAYINPFIKVNAGGIPRLLAEAATTSGNDVTYDFREHKFLNYPYAGLIIFKLPAITGPTTAGDVFFTSGGNNKVQVYSYSGTALESNNAELVTGGIFIGWYSDNKLELLNISD